MLTPAFRSRGGVRRRIPDVRRETVWGNDLRETGEAQRLRWYRTLPAPHGAQLTPNGR